MYLSQVRSRDHWLVFVLYYFFCSRTVLLMHLGGIYFIFRMYPYVLLWATQEPVNFVKGCEDL